MATFQKGEDQRTPIIGVFKTARGIPKVEKLTDKKDWKKRKGTPR